MVQESFLDSMFTDPTFEPPDPPPFHFRDPDASSN